MTTPTIVIVNWNGGRMFQSALISILSSHKVEDYNLILVDNGSDDESREFLSGPVFEMFGQKIEKEEPLTLQMTYDSFEEIGETEKLEPRKKIKTVTVDKHIEGGNIQVFLLNRNYRYETGVNIGMSYSEGDVILMGSDVELFKGTVPALVKSAYLHPKIGLVAARLMQRMNNSDYFVISGGFTEVAGKEHIIGRRSNDGPWREFKEYTWCTFSLVYIKKDCIKETGLMNMDFHVYCGDRDFAYRARENGWAVIFSPIANAIHLDGRTVSKLKRSISKQQWDEEQGFEMRRFCLMWRDRTPPFPILPEGLFDEPNTWPGRD